MAGFSFQKQSEFQNHLEQIYNSAPDYLKESVTADDFINSFAILEVNGKGQEPSKPEEYEIDDNTFNQVLIAFREVYHS